MKTKLSLDYSTILANEARPVHLAVTFEAPNTLPARPQPVAFVVVLDRSGSMGGAPLQSAKKAAIAIVRNLRPGDFFGMVVFDSHAQTLIPLSDARDQRAAIRTIESVHTGGATNLTGGWSLGRDLLRSAPPGSPRRILLLTDGMANVGITDSDIISQLVGEACEQSQVRTSCLGFGDQYSEDLLKNMAGASGGELHDANDPDRLPAIFATELEGLQSLAIQNLRIRVTPTHSVDDFILLGAYPEPVIDGNSREYAIGDLVSDEERIIVLALSVLPIPMMDDGRPAATWDGEKLLDLEIHFDAITDTGIEIHRETHPVYVRPVQDPAAVKFDVEVIAWVSLQAAASCVDHAIKMKDDGNGRAAVRLLKGEIARLTQLPGSPVIGDAIRLLNRALDTILHEEGYVRGRKVLFSMATDYRKMSSRDATPGSVGELPSFKRRRRRPTSPQTPLGKDPNHPDGSPDRDEDKE